MPERAVLPFALIDDPPEVFLRLYEPGGFVSRAAISAKAGNVR